MWSRELVRIYEMDSELLYDTKFTGILKTSKYLNLDQTKYSETSQYSFSSLIWVYSMKGIQY